MLKKTRVENASVRSVRFSVRADKLQSFDLGATRFTQGTCAETRQRNGSLCQFRFLPLFSTVCLFLVRDISHLANGANSVPLKIRRISCIKHKQNMFQVYERKRPFLGALDLFHMKPNLGCPTHLSSPASSQICLAVSRDGALELNYPTQN